MLQGDLFTQYFLQEGILATKFREEFVTSLGRNL